MRPNERLMFIPGCLVVFFGLAFSVFVEIAQADDKAGPLAISTVGIAKRIDQIVIPGGKLQAKPLQDRHQAFVLRVIEVYPHGTDSRYDLEFYALEPGEYNLAEYLTRTDANSTEALPSLPVRVDATLPAGQITPSKLVAAPLPALGGYKAIWFAGALIWLGGLYALLNVGRKRLVPVEAVVAKQASLADRLRPLVQAARDGTLESEQRAALERVLIAYWCQKLQLSDVAPGKVMSKLREHSEAGPLVRSLEEWLHCPDPPKSVDINVLLKPYAEVRDMDFEVASA
jgi:hypothetical protein